MEVRKRAKEKGIGHNSQHKLDEIARRRPELLSKIANGEFSIYAAFRLCHPTKIRWRTWQATLRLEKEREIFRAKIGSGCHSSNSRAELINE